LKIAKGIDLMGEGEFGRAFEAMTPNFLAAPAKAARYADEGLQSKRGDVMVPKEDIGASGVIGQGLGFTPDAVRRRWDQNSQAFNYKKRVDNRRRHIYRSVNRALDAGTFDATFEDKILPRIEAFNRMYPEVPIDRAGLRSSISAWRRAREGATHGAHLGKLAERAFAENRIP